MRDDSSLKLGSLPVLSTGPLFWRSLEELAGTGRTGRRSRPWNFQTRRSRCSTSHSRRDFLRFMAASLALGGVSGLRLPADRVDRALCARRPRRSFPARPLFFASAVPIDGYACGVLVKSHMGRPIKLEGNPAHPASLGAVDIFGQATILTLYDPDRSQLVTRNGRVDTWEHLQTLLLDSREKLHQRPRGRACAS